MRTATVKAAVATLWSRPDAPRPKDAPAIGPDADARAWVSGLDERERQYIGVLTQLLEGEPVLVEEIEGDWAFVVATAQPAARLDPRGYPGWLPLAQLEFASPTHAPAAQAAQPAHDVLEVARAWLGAPYVWGGLTAHGIDCSGLVHLAFRRTGLTLPRDAHDQAAATVPVPAGQEQPGDLYFFSAKPGRVTHVGFVSGPDQMLHACGDKGLVVEEPMPQDRRATLFGVH